MEFDMDAPRMDGVRIAYIGGGSLNWARVLMVGLAMEPRLSGSVRLYDIDLAAARENAVMGNRLSARGDAPGKWSYEAAGTLAEALEGADFVILSILPGTFAEMASDVHTPEKYGVYQSVGDTVGPGGAIRALRTIPMYREFGEGIRRYCPEAWVINYTNPMTVCTRTLYEAFPGIRAFGCCHEVFGTQRMAADMAERRLGVRGASRSDIRTNVLGINHFTWIDRISCGPHDLMPLYREIAREHAGDGYLCAGDAYDRASFFRCANMVKFDLMNRYGIIAAAGDRHLAEFMPPWYLRDPQTAERWGFALTPVSWRVGDRERLAERRRRITEGREELELAPTGEEGILQIKALLGMGDLVTNVNLPNSGQIEGLPSGAVVETNALFSRGSVRPVFAGRLPDDVNALVLRHVGNQEALVKAAFSMDRRLALHAFANDPLLARLDIAAIESLFGEMVENTKEYLPEYLLQRA